MRILEYYCDSNLTIENFINNHIQRSEKLRKIVSESNINKLASESKDNL